MSELAPFTPRRRATLALEARAHYHHAVVNKQEPGIGFVLAMCAFNTQEWLVARHGMDEMPLPGNDNAPAKETRP